jgi:hypothetical protein
MHLEEKRAMAALMRRLAIFMAERRSLITILKEAARDARVPQQWEQELKHLQAAPEYRAILDEYEPTIRKLEEDADFEALLPLIRKATEASRR